MKQRLSHASVGWDGQFARRRDIKFKPGKTPDYVIAGSIRNRKYKTKTAQKMSDKQRLQAHTHGE